MISARDAKMYALECATSDDRLYKTILESVARGELYCTKEYISEGMIQLLEYLGYKVQYYDFEGCYKIDWE